MTWRYAAAYHSTGLSTQAEFAVWLLTICSVTLMMEMMEKCMSCKYCWTTAPGSESQHKIPPVMLFSIYISLWQPVNVVTEFWSLEPYFCLFDGNCRSWANSRSCVCLSGSSSCSGQCWAQTPTYQMSCFTAGRDTFMLCSTWTKRWELTRWMRTPLQRWHTHLLLYKTPVKLYFVSTLVMVQCQI